MKNQKKEKMPGYLRTGWSIGDLFHQLLEYLVPHAFDELDASDDKVPTSTDPPAFQLVSQFTDHFRDIHHHTP